VAREAGEVGQEDLSGNLIVPFRLVTEHLNRLSAFSVSRPCCRGPCQGSGNIAVVRRRMDSARDGRSGCLRRHSSKRSKNLLESRI